MAIKDIILHQGTDARSAARLDMALALAKAHDARLIGVFAKVDPSAPEYWWLAFGKKNMARWLSALEDSAAEAERAFKTRLAEEGVAGEWRVLNGSPTDALMACARHGDLAVIGQSDPDEAAGGDDLPDRLILGAGVPVLVVPYAGDFTNIGRRVMVAWNGSREAIRSLHDAMPLLRRAETVMIYSVNPASDRHLAGADIAAHLARHGVKAEASHGVFGRETEAVGEALTTVGGYGFQQRGAWTRSRHPPVGEIDVGDALLSAVTDHAADLLVMGAYGRSRLRELVLGGATRQVLKTMTVPVLMSN
jgi:nucleotide-binding universal stress UspA family protein